MKPSGASGLVNLFTNDRFRVEDVRAMQRRERQNADDFVQEFSDLQLAGGNDLVSEYGQFNSMAPHIPEEMALDRAFDLYLQRGVGDGITTSMPQPMLMEKALHKVMSAFPRMSPEMARDKATEMLHNLHLDQCRGGPHHHHQDWAHEMMMMEPSSSSRHMMMRMDEGRREWTQQYDGFVRERRAREADEWAHDMRMESAYQEGSWAQEMVADEMAGLDRAYEAEKWADEYRDDNKAKQDQEDDDDGWYEQFLEKEKSLKVDSLKQISARLNAIDDPKLQNSQFMAFVRNFTANEGKHPDEWANEFSSQPTLQRDRLMNMMTRKEGGGIEDWVNEYEEFNSLYPDAEFEGAWDRPNEGGFMQAQPPQEYVFSPQNPYQNAKDPFQMGRDFFENGRFAEAVLALEAAVSRDPQNGRAWHLLGKSHQEGDKDWQAILALQKATECDPSNLLGLVDKAVSYTNNLQKDMALDSLESWLRNNPRYSKLAPPPRAPGQDITQDLRDLYERQDVLIDCFVEAAQTSPDNVDPEVQICLGLLYTLALEYDNAAQCFQAALTKMPQDYGLWNKLGATLANSGRSQEALQAYFQALERKPLYVRARANLGISFLAMRMYMDAAKQFLAALSIEPDAVHIWTNLETAFSYMHRQDLLDKAKERRVDLFRSEFDF